MGQTTHNTSHKGEITHSKSLFTTNTGRSFTTQDDHCPHKGDHSKQIHCPHRGDNPQHKITTALTGYSQHKMITAHTGEIIQNKCSLPEGRSLRTQTKHCLYKGDHSHHKIIIANAGNTIHKRNLLPSVPERPLAKQMYQCAHKGD